MSLSIPGALVCIGLALLGWLLRAPVVVPLFASLAFGSTAIVNLTSLGGSSPLIYTLFAAVLLATVTCRRHFWFELRHVFAQFRTAFVICALITYACVGAVLLPRLFAGKTSALTATRTQAGAGAIVEVPLGPTGGNITQCGYFVLGALVFFAACILLLQRESVTKFRRGYLAWAAMHAVHGLIDLSAKSAGLGDVLAPIRTASYAMLTEVEHGGFFRIAGGYSEASAFGGVTLACAVFTFADWRVSRSRYVLVLAVTLFLLVLLSTSSTAYVALSVILVVSVATVLWTLVNDRLVRSDLATVAVGGLAITTTLGVYLFDPRIFGPLVTLFEATISNKGSSESAVERWYWNGVSLQSALDTGFLGVGLGSSRASSFAIAVISQLGLFGTVLLLALISVLACRIRQSSRSPADREIVSLHDGARAAALCSVVTGSIASGTADPGIMFFIALAVTLACRRHAELRVVGAPGHQADVAGPPRHDRRSQLPPTRPGNASRIPVGFPRTGAARL